MTDPVPPQMQRGDYLWSAGILLVIATAFIYGLTRYGDPANSLHMKSLDGWLGLVWVAAGIACGGVVQSLAAIIRK